MKDLIAKFRALPLKARAMLVVLCAFSAVTAGDYAFRTRPAALNAGRPVIIPRTGNGKFGVTGDNPQGVTITGSGMDLASLKLLHVANGTASTDGAAFGQIAATTLNSFAVPTGTVNMSNQTLASVADPVAAQDAVNLRAMNAVAHPTTDAACLTNVASLSGTAVSCDGIAMSTAGVSRPLLTAQSTASQNGPWVVQSGAWTRPADFPAAAHAYGAEFRAVQGSTKAASVWLVTTTLAAGDIVGTNNLTLVQTNAGGGSVTFGAVQSALASASSAVGFNAQTVQNIANGALATDAINLSQKKLHGALFVSTGPLPANTYSNGTGGHGAALTYSSNVACGLIDGHTVALNDVGLVAAEATMANNGLYKATQLGDGSTTGCILTRVDYADDPVELAGLQVEVLDGFTAKTGAPVYILVAPSASITVGTSPIVFMRATISGSPRLAYSWSTDFDSQLATVANGIAVNNSPFTASISGTGASFAFNNTASGNTDTEIGIATITSGTTAAATASVGNSGAAFNWGTNAAIWIVTKMRVHTALSGATNTFDCHIGTVASAFAAGVWESCDSNADPHWRLNVKSAGTTTIAGTSLIVLDQWDTHLIWKDAGTSQVHWAISGVRQPDPATTNTPVSTPTGPYMSAERTAGTGGVIQLDYTAGQYYYPLGRGL